MKIELRSVHYSERMSEETSCFDAAVYIDGVKAGTVCNRGTGGSDEFNPWELQTRLDAYGATLPKKVADFLDSATGKPFEMEQNAESLIGDLLTDYLVTRDFKRDLRNKLLFTKADGKLYQIKAKNAADLPTLLEAAKAGRYAKDAVAILNTLPEADALTLYRTAGAR